MLALRPVRPDDHAWCYEVKRDGLREYTRVWFGWDDADQRARFAEGFQPARAQIVVYEGVDIGWMAKRATHDRVYLDQLYLSAAHRGRGVGTQLLRDILVEAGGRDVELGVLKNNPALRLYHRFGFRVVADGDYKWVMRRRAGPAPDEPVSVNLSEEAQRELCHDLPIALSGRGERAPIQGVANHTWLFDRHVVRIANGAQVSFDDARTEAVAVPAAISAGVGAAPLRWFEERHDRTDAPVTVYERLPGGPVGDDPAPQVWAEVGRQLATLHQRVEHVPDGAGWLETHKAPDLMWALSHAGADRDRLTTWARTLPNEGGNTAFLHGDPHQNNVLARKGVFAGLIDWGDAGFGDVAYDFEPIPIAMQPAAVEAWRAATGWQDETLEGRILRIDLAVALYRIAEPKPHRPPRMYLDALLAFLNSNPGPRWRRWF